MEVVRGDDVSFRIPPILVLFGDEVCYLGKVSVKVNGVISPSFRPTRGIRQGDLMSPYLFLLCSEGLTSMLKARGPQYISKGVRVSRHAPWISHLLFAEDCLIFTQASKRGADRIAEILELYNRG
jgi:hypothetical protein